MEPNRLRELREAAGLTLQALAAACGTTAPQIMKLERGDRRMTIDWMTRLARALGCDPRDLMPAEARGTGQPAGQSPARVPAAGRILLAGGEAALGPPPRRVDYGDLIPVRSAARGGDEQIMFLHDGPIDYVPRPPWLAHVRDAYTIYMVGDSMMPRFRQGQLLHVHPHRPPQPGSGVVVTLASDAVQIKEFVARSESRLVLRQYNPEALIEHKLAQVRATDTVVGLEEP